MMKKGYEDLSVTALAADPSAYRIVDVREPAELIGPLGKIASAENVPLRTVPQVLGASNREEPIVLVCRSGGRSARAAQQLAAIGYRHLYNLDGGMMSWNEAGLPVER